MPNSKDILSRIPPDAKGISHREWTRTRAKIQPITREELAAWLRRIEREAADMKRKFGPKDRR